MRDSENQNLIWQKLLADARAGDSSAMGEVLERLRGYLMLVAERTINNDVKTKLGASDVVQESMLEAHHNLQQFNGDSEVEFRAWLKKILQYNLIDATRKFRNTGQRDVSREVFLGFDNGQTLPGDVETPSLAARRSEEDQALAKAVLNLPATKRCVIELRHRDGLSYRKIAQQLGVTEEAARKTWSRAVSELREILVDQ